MSDVRHATHVEPGDHAEHAGAVADPRRENLGPHHRRESGTERMMAALPDVVKATGEATGQAVGQAVGGMGIKGLLWTNVGNASAMVVICVVFIWNTFAQQAEMKEVRLLFRQEVMEVRQSNDRRFDKLAERYDALSREQQQLTSELRRLTDALYQTNRELRAIPKQDPQSRRPPGTGRLPLAAHDPREVRP